jgi:hypothetical protein
MKSFQKNVETLYPTGVGGTMVLRVSQCFMGLRVKIEVLSDYRNTLLSKE